MRLKRSYRDIIAAVKENVIGQPRAVEQLERALKLADAGLRDKARPLAILLFAGPTGTGKSEVVRALAEAIHDNPDRLCRVDCNLLKQSHAASSLSGSPPGYVGSVDGDTLLQKNLIEGVNGRPGILVFEEVEKAHPDIFDTLLGIFDKGVLNLNNGRGQISFTNTIIVMTSNAGARALSDAANGKRIGFAPVVELPHELSSDDRKNIVMKELQELFRPEFINRVDDIVVFRWLAKPELDIIVDKFLGQLAARLKQYPHFLNVMQSAKDFLVANGTDVANGARPLKRAIRRYLEDPLAELLVDGLPYPQVMFHVWHYQGDSFLSIKAQEVPAIEPPPVLAVAEGDIEEPEPEIEMEMNQGEGMMLPIDDEDVD